MHYIYPPKFYITFAFYFSLVLHFGGQIICVVGDVQAEYEIDFSPPGLQDIFFWVQAPSPPLIMYMYHITGSGLAARLVGYHDYAHVQEDIFRWILSWHVFGKTMLEIIC